MSVARDVRFALRSLRRAPLFTLAAVLTLAIGIGANSAVFGVVRGLLLSPLPYASPAELVVVWGEHPDIGHEEASLPDFLDWREQQASFSHISAIGRAAALLSGRDGAERLDASMITGDLFATLGRQPLLGRTFTEDEHRSNGPDVVILGNGLWQRRFAGDSSIVGTDILVSGLARTVVGVVQDDVPLMDRSDLFFPIRTDTTMSRRGNWLGVIGRLETGVTAEAADADMRAIMSRLEAEYPGSNAGWTADVVPLHTQVVGDVRPALLAFAGAVGLVLLIACANVANLFLARAAAREQEMAVRVTLGAGRLHLVRQLLAESMILAGAGAALGLLLASNALALVRHSEALQLPRAETIAVDPMVLLFTVATAGFSAMLFGLAPMLRVARGQLKPGVSATRSATGSVAIRRTRAALVFGEVALALVLLVGAGLLIRSFDSLQRVRPGFDARNVLAAQVLLPGATMMDSAGTAAFWPDVLQRLAAVPGVVGTAYINVPPMGGVGYTTFALEGRPSADAGTVEDVQPYVVSRDYFHTMGIQVMEGRTFDATDNATAARTAMVNQEFVRRYSDGRPVVGRGFTFGDPEDPGTVWYTIIGTVADVAQEGLDRGGYPQVYRTMDQVPVRSGYAMVRTSGDPLSMVPTVRSAVASAAPDAAVASTRTMTDRMSATVARPRASATLLTGFALVALLLAAIGIYGVMAYTTALRTREVGIRLALGGSPSSVLRLIVKQGMLPVAGGMALGAAGALLAGRVLGRFLFGVGSADPLTFSLTALLLAGVAVAACWLPARRALRTEPATLLRSD